MCKELLKIQTPTPEKNNDLVPQNKRKVIFKKKKPLSLCLPSIIDHYKENNKKKLISFLHQMKKKE